ncbi:MAG: arginine repressor [Ignavibacteria bacterium]|nr:arginine repressor [Ignavibacteria bacterium]
MSAKLRRQNRIKEILGDYDISNQDELSLKLKEEGFSVTQATLSRDFAELGVIRTVANGGIRYILNPEETGKQIAKLISYEILSVDHNESIIVVRTIAGRAQGVAHFIDRLNRKEIIGTVGGDDTVLVMPDSHKNIPVIVNMIKKMMNELDEN